MEVAEAIDPPKKSTRSSAMEQLLRWFAKNRWKPFPFQRQAWDDCLDGKSGLIHAPTGTGKTYAVALPPMIGWLAKNPERPGWPETVPLTVLWITPLRALANDTAQSILKPITDLSLPWTVELRTGDTSAALRARHRERFPTVFITTPESLSLLLSYADSYEKLASLQFIIVDEWHDLLGTKRGVQTELCLARLRHWMPHLRTWGLSATLGNLDQALRVLTGDAAANASLISGDLKKKVEIEVVIPEKVESFPWAGHLGLDLLPEVVKRLEKHPTTLLFTNTRSQTEIWFQELRKARPDWESEIGVHHGSISRDARENVEARLRAGTIRCVVCTASLDLGVDFSPVSQVIQIGAPKGVARMLQRAGRSGHRPGAVSKIVCVPAHALELVEFAAVREAIAGGELEARPPLEHPLDVLAQHMVTVALGSGFIEADFFEEVRKSHAYRDLTREEWQWCLDFVVRGGAALRAYPQYARVVEENGVYVVQDLEIGRLHRMSVGTITSDSAMAVRVMRGPMLGTIEESFIGRLKPGSKFSFAGFTLELVRVRDMTAYVRKVRKLSGTVPQWMGGKMPLSTQLAAVVRRKLAEARCGKFTGAEMRAAAPILKIQNKWSRLPNPDELLVERWEMKGGTHHFIFPFAGRLVHEGLAALAAYRVSQILPVSIAMTLNDYGIGLLSGSTFKLTDDQWRKVFRSENLFDDLAACLNSAELARRQFREVARIAGLIFQGYPGQSKSARQLQASSGLFYDVFVRYDPKNLLLQQAQREVWEKQLETSRLAATLRDICGMKLVCCEIPRLSPLSFPLWASFVQANITSEQWSERVKRMALQLQNAAASDLAK